MVSVPVSLLFALLAAAPSSPPPAATGATTPAPDCTTAPIRPTGKVHYFCNCDPGAEAECIPGDDARDGRTPARARRTKPLAGLAALAAGDTIALCRGGAWTSGASIEVAPGTEFPADRPVEIRDYPVQGRTRRPILDAGSSVAFAFWHGRSGGIRIWNLDLRGSPKVDGVVQVITDVHDLDLCGNRIAGGYVGINMAPTGTYDTRIRVRRNAIEDGAFSGFVGGAPGITIEGNVFSNNGTLGSMHMHSAYLVSDPAHGATDAAAPTPFTFSNNSIEAGDYCAGALLVVHGVWINNRLTVENNLLRTTSTTGSCYGIALSGGNSGAEFHEAIVRRNRVFMQSPAQSAIEVDCCQDCVVSDNLVVRGQLAIANAPCHPGAFVGARGTYQNNTVFGAPMVIGPHGAGPHDVDNNAVWTDGDTCQRFVGPVRRRKANYCRARGGEAVGKVFVDAPGGDFRPVAGGPLDGSGSAEHFSATAPGSARWTPDDRGVPRRAPVPVGALTP
jgi:hypothetical protein